MQVYVASNPLLDEAQHVAIVNAANGGTVNPQPEPKVAATDMTVSEIEAGAGARSLGISWRSLRDHAVGIGMAVKRKSRVFYSRFFLDRLCSEWMTKDRAMRLMGIESSTAYHNRVNNHGIETLVIGRASLAKSADVARSLGR